MANPTVDKQKDKLKNNSKDVVGEPEYPLTTMAIVAPIVGWLVPGGGHILPVSYTHLTLPTKA